jgi:signal transduction histidine kinase
MIMSGCAAGLRHCAEHLPHIQPHGSELNQVRANIIQNAIDAMGATGISR